MNEKINIRVVIPVLHSDELVDKCRHEYDHAAGPDVAMSYVCLEHGTSTIESKLDLALAQPDTIRCCIEAEHDGCDAVVIACFGVRAATAPRRRHSSQSWARERPPSTSGACSEAGSQSSPCSRRPCRSWCRWSSAQDSCQARLGSCDPVRGDGLRPQLRPDVVEQAAAAVSDDGAEVVVMGCTGTGVDMVPQITELLADRLGTYVPVIDPVCAAVSLAEACARHSYRPSKRAFPTRGTHGPTTGSQAQDHDRTPTINVEEGACLREGFTRIRTSRTSAAELTS